MQYPLSMVFKIFALAPQIYVRDASGGMVCYVRQKLFRLKEAVNVFTDESQKQKLCEIRADRMIDWSASYHFFAAHGEPFGAVRRKGMRSLWSAHYEVLDETNRHYATISEVNPMAKVMDSMLGEIPILGLLTGYFFHPIYSLKDNSGRELLRLTKRRAFLEGKFTIEKAAECDEVDELRGLMAFLMMSLLERARG
ncbi:MAG: hypothetical protein ACK53V_18420 [Planctomycetota bacterium]